MDRKEIICECFLVSRGEIEDAIREKKLKTVEDVGYVTNAGTGCGGCQGKIQEILDKVNGKK
ncbi:MAG: (2Fe-2S)-binding protein [Bacteroidales bacterium]|jgi:NAD(P)H-nitrite reductase large subunit|nr:(2Fe-2S)-binding protein [Bacteroidales bacterium]MBQ3521453.1 (2Fe-2S)-binding protein [Bacteroidales bacterium]MBQ5804122.1 (2Fe-2S)-binding protein [Bacteroidales bacterium]MBQ6871403.1 (2Fe-2S)-binding protein [Bacteroidales bacterium]MBQ7997955.1 (2Fe-2S)-binding protein [Bacteroidales bacterium]